MEKALAGDTILPCFRLAIHLLEGQNMHRPTCGRPYPRGACPQACPVRQGANAEFEKSDGRDTTRCQVRQITRKHRRCGMQARTIRLLRMFLVVGLWTLWLAAAATAAVPTVPGMSYYSVSYADFVPYDSSVVKRVFTDLGAYTNGGNLNAKTDLPHGAYVYDVTVWGGAGGQVHLRRANHGAPYWDTLASLTLPAGTGIVSTTFVLATPFRVDTGQASYHLQIFAISSATAILSVRIGYRLDAGDFYYVPASTGGGAVIYLD